MNADPKLSPRAAAGAAGWTGERVELLEKLWRDGLSASQIAKRLGSVSRNSVIGKLSRLGLTQGGIHGTRAKPSAPRHVAKLELRTQAKAFGETKVKPALVFANPGSEFSTEPKAPFAGISRNAAQPLPGSSPKPWMERRFGECTWIVGGEGHEALSCCEPIHAGSWCEVHHQLGHVRAAPGKPQTANDMMRSLRRHVA